MQISNVIFTDTPKDTPRKKTGPAERDAGVRWAGMDCSTINGGSKPCRHPEQIKFARRGFSDWFQPLDWVTGG